MLLVERTWIMANLTPGKFRKHLGMPALLEGIFGCFRKIPDKIAGREFRLVDYLKAGLAMFWLKQASLLQFDRLSHGAETIQHNLKQLFDMVLVPRDSSLRWRLDLLPHSELREVFNCVFQRLQRGKVLEYFKYWGKSVLISTDFLT